MNRPIHFEIQADDPTRAAKFYFEKYAGSQMDYWVVTTGPEGTPGINGDDHHLLMHHRYCQYR